MCLNTCVCNFKHIRHKGRISKTFQREVIIEENEPVGSKGNDCSVF
jgi:hypothetical protein